MKIARDRFELATLLEPRGVRNSRARGSQYSTNTQRHNAMYSISRTIEMYQAMSKEKPRILMQQKTGIQENSPLVAFIQRVWFAYP